MSGDPQRIKIEQRQGGSFQRDVFPLRRGVYPVKIVWNFQRIDRGGNEQNAEHSRPQKLVQDERGNGIATCIDEQTAQDIGFCVFKFHV